MDPLGIALETMESKNQEIQLLTAIHTTDKTLSINPLSMLLNGVIDAAVMGGIGNYEKIFFNPDYISEPLKIRTGSRNSGVLLRNR